MKQMVALYVGLPFAALIGLMPPAQRGQAGVAHDLQQPGGAVATAILRERLIGLEVSILNASSAS